MSSKKNQNSAQKIEILKKSNIIIPKQGKTINSKFQSISSTSRIETSEMQKKQSISKKKPIKNVKETHNQLYLKNNQNGSSLKNFNEGTQKQEKIQFHINLSNLSNRVSSIDRSSKKNSVEKYSNRHKALNYSEMALSPKIKGFNFGNQLSSKLLLMKLDKDQSNSSLGNDSNSSNFVEKNKFFNLQQLKQKNVKYYNSFLKNLRQNSFHNSNLPFQIDLRTNTVDSHLKIEELNQENSLISDETTAKKDSINSYKNQSKTFAFLNNLEKKLDSKSIDQNDAFERISFLKTIFEEFSQKNLFPEAQVFFHKIEDYIEDTLGKFSSDKSKYSKLNTKHNQLMIKLCETQIQLEEKNNEITNLKEILKDLKDDSHNYTRNMRSETSKSYLRNSIDVINFEEGNNKEITKINKLNLDDLEAIYFVDKVHFRSKSEYNNKNIPKIDIKMALEIAKKSKEKSTKLESKTNLKICNENTFHE